MTLTPPTPELLDQDFIKAANKLFLHPCVFTAGSNSEESLPEPTLPEVAFAGRSNVGKSSIINALTNQKHLARISRTPGRTQQLNFFNLADRLLLVDLPGYGYAEVSKRQKLAWHHLIYRYLRGRVLLRRVYLLIDSRHGLKSLDYEVMRALDEAATPYQVTLTKVDKLTLAQQEEMIKKVTEELKKHAAAYPYPLATSSETKVGIEELRTSIAVAINTNIT